MYIRRKPNNTRLALSLLDFSLTGPRMAQPRCCYGMPSSGVSASVCRSGWASVLNVTASKSIAFGIQQQVVVLEGRELGRRRPWRQPVDRMPVPFRSSAQVFARLRTAALLAL